MNFIKPCNAFLLALAVLCFIDNRTYSQTANQWGSPVFGAQLSISVSNNVISSGSTALVQCISTNSSTNGICFRTIDSKWMYEISLVDALGNSVVLTGPQFIGDGSDIRGKLYNINQNGSYACLVPVVFGKKVVPGIYRMVAKQDVYVPGYNNQKAKREQLVSNSITIVVK